MCCYLALPHVYLGTATANDGIREEGRGGADELLSFLPRARDDTAEGRRRGVKLDRC